MADPVIVNDSPATILINEGPEIVQVTNGQGAPLDVNNGTPVSVTLDQSCSTEIEVNARPGEVTVNVAADEVVQVVGTGPQGPAGSSSGSFLLYTQNPASATWTIAHNFGRKPLLSVVDLGGIEIFGGVTHLSDNVVQICFETPIAGTATLL